MSAGPVRALIVEDNPADVRLVRLYVEEAARAGPRPWTLELETAPQLGDALRRLEEAAFDVILLDLSLPDSAGLATLGRVLAHSRAAPVVVLSGTGDEALALQAVAEGAQDYLVKGRFDGQLLLRAIRYAIERSRVEIALRESEARFRQVAEQIGEVFWLASADLREILYLSPAFERVTGLLARDVYESPSFCFEAVHPEDREALVAGARACLKARRPGSFEFRIVRPEGRVVWLQCRMAPVPGGDGGILRVAGIAEDVSERHKLGEQLRQTRKLEAVGRLAAGVAHDFNNFLTLIEGHAEFALSHAGDSPPLRGALEEIRQAAGRATSLTRQLLFFTRPREVAVREMDPNETVAAMANMLRRLLGSDLVLRTALAPDAGRVRLDPTSLEQILLNLAVNARDAMPRGGSLLLATARETAPDGGDWLRLSVRDTGTGMDEATRARIFEPFFTTKAEDKGTGLGLATVFAAVSDAGGRVEVESEPGRGSVFHILLPRVAAAPAAPRPAAASAAAPPRGAGTVLLVEDDPAIRGLFAKGLTRHGYRALEAADGAHALAILAREEDAVRLLITDFVMPGMSGGELAARARELRPALRVLFVSGHAESALQERGLGSGHRVLRKPFPVSALLAEVHEALDPGS